MKSVHLLDTLLDFFDEQLFCREATPALAMGRESMLHHMTTNCGKHDLPCFSTVQAVREGIVGYSTETASILRS